MKLVLKFITLTALFVGSLSCTAQLTNKALKSFEKAIPKLYEAKEYKEVHGIVHQLYTSNKAPKKKTYTYWLNSAYQLHDLWLCRAVVQHMDSLGIKPAVKKYNQQTTDIINRLRLIMPIAPNDTNFIHDTTQVDHYLSVFKQIHNIDSSFWQPNSILGLLYYRKKEYDIALKHLHAAHKHQQKNHQIARLIGYAYYQKGDYKQALLTLNNISAQNENNPEYFMVTATCYLGEKAYTNALIHAQIASELNPTLLYPYHIQKDAAHKRSNLDAELKASLKLLEYGPVDEALARSVYELSKQKYGKEQSLALANQRCAQHPTNQNFILVRLDHYTWGDKDNLEAAMQDYARLIALDSTYGRYHILKGYYLFRSPKSPEQRKLASAALDKFYSFDSLYFYQYDYQCRLFMWYDQKRTKHYKRLAIKNMRIKYALDTNNAASAFELASAYDLPDNGTGSGQNTMTQYSNITTSHCIMVTIQWK